MNESYIPPSQFLPTYGYLGKSANHMVQNYIGLFKKCQHSSAVVVVVVILAAASAVVAAVVVYMVAAAAAAPSAASAYV